MVDRVPGTLFVVSTPIGNMGDFSFRGVEILRSVSVVLAEDARHARHLLDRYDVRARLESYHEHNEARTSGHIVQRMLEGESVALISDAGTPLLSDPGERLVRAAVDAGIRIEAVPGASALLAALVVSGMPAEPFTFFGFLPRKGTERKRTLNTLATLEHTSIIYESPARLAATLAELAEHCGADRECVITRELTKLHEEVRRGTLAEHEEYYAEAQVRGEIVLVLGGAAPAQLDEGVLRTRAASLRSEGMTSREIVAILVREHGAPRNVAYRLTQEE